jgi:transposase
MGMGASLVVEGSTNRIVFETYLEDVLCPTLKRGQVVVMDNLSSHKGERVRELIEGKGWELIYLPPYSPDFNPIEQAFSKLKSYLPEACALVPSRRSWSSSTKLSIRSPLRMRRASSNIVATGRWFNLYDRRSRSTEFSEVRTAPV